MPKCAKLTYSNLEFQNFPGRTPGSPSSGGGEGRGRERRTGRGKGREGGRGRIGKGGEGREGTGEGRREGGMEGVVGRAGALGMPPSLETSSGSAPATIRSQTKRSVSKLSSPSRQFLSACRLKTSFRDVYRHFNKKSI